MTRIVSFVIRLVGYAIVIGVCGRIAQYFWERQGLDQIPDLQGWHDVGMTVLAFAPLVLALIGGILPRIAFFLTFFIAAAVLTAPYAFARLVQ